MTAPVPANDFRDARTAPIFGTDARAAFAAAYPNSPATFRHALADHPLLTLDALAALGEALGLDSVEYNRSDIPVGTLPDGAPSNGLGIADTIRQIAANKSWAVLKNIEAVPAYADLLSDLLAEFADSVRPRTGPMLTLQGFVFVSSPHSVTPFHFDPEHNILMQMVGRKTMFAYPAADTRFAAQVEHERYHTGGKRELPWDPNFTGQAYEAPLGPGDAVLMPVMAPHYVKNGPEPSISLSITWRSEWSYREAEAHAANRWLRERGFAPSSMPPRWPGHARAKTLAWRAARKVGLVA
jgi:Cupin-like domain